jgi:hypothetical protein
MWEEKEREKFLAFQGNINRVIQKREKVRGSVWGNGIKERTEEVGKSKGNSKGADVKDCKGGEEDWMWRLGKEL